MLRWLMMMVSIEILMLLLFSFGYGQPIPYGYIDAGHDGIVSTAFVARDGFVLDSAVNYKYPGFPQKDMKLTYGFKYNAQERLVSDSNITFRSDPFKDSVGRFFYVRRPGRRQYIYNERGAVDSVAYSYWVDSVWVADSASEKFFYSDDGKLLSSRYSDPDNPTEAPIVHNYVYDGSGRLIIDTVYRGTQPDTSYTYRRYDSQNRLAVVRRREARSWSPQEITYEYYPPGIVHSVTRSYVTDDSVVNVINSYRIFDGAGRLLKDSTAYASVTDPSIWGPYSVVTYTYDEKGRILIYGDNGATRCTYTPDGNLDTLICKHPVIPDFLGAHFVDSYGNDMALYFDYMLKFYYHSLVTGVEKQGGAPTAFVLAQNYPNPFNPSTTIRYSVPHRSHVTLTVFNTLGQQVATLVNGDIDAGSHEVRFDGGHLASGVYFYRMQAGGYVDTKKFCLVR